MTIIDYFSLVPVPIILSFNSNEISRATGFFYSRENQNYLVTNWHVLSGRNAETGLSLDSKNLCIPNQIEFEVNGNPIGVKLTSGKIPLLHDDNTNWFQHPQGQKIDLACLPIDLPESVVLYYPTSNNAAEPLTHEVGNDCFVVGFPLTHEATKNTVVWKRATIATEFELNFNSLPCFLVDATTSSGMSGSPVFFRRSGSVRYASGSMGFIPNGSATEFVGVYSGRYVNPGAKELSLGYVWKRSLINEMVDARVSGSYDLKQKI